MRKKFIFIILFFISRANATDSYCRNVVLETIQTQQTQKISQELNSDKQIQAIGAVLREMKSRGVNVNSQKNVDKETDLILALTKKYFGESMSKRAFFSFLYTKIGGWKEVLKAFDLNKKEKLSDEKIKYLSFLLTLQERSSNKNTANELLKNTDLFMTVYAEFFPQSQAKMSAVLSRIDLLFENWDAAVDQLNDFDVLVRVKSEKANVFAMFQKLNREGLNIENYKLIDELGEEQWADLTNEVFGRSISKRTFKTISMKYGGIARILKELALGFEFKKRKTWTSEKLLNVLRELNDANIDISVWSDIIEHEDIAKRIIKKHTNTDMQVISFLKKVAIEFGSLFDAVLELGIDVKGKKGARISRYKKEIMDQVESVGINKEQNFYQNRLLFWKTAEEKTGVKFRKDEIKSWIAKFYGTDRIYFKEKLFYSELKPILLKNIEASGWNYDLHSLNDNFKFLKQIIENIYGFAVSPFRVYAFIVVFELDESNFNLNGALLALAQANYARHLKSFEMTDIKVGFDNDSDEFIIVDENSNPALILENEQSNKHDLVKRIIKDFVFANPTMAEQILDATIDHDVRTVDQIVEFVPNCTESDVLEVFKTIQKNKDLFMEIL